MFKKCFSYLILFSFLYNDIACCGSYMRKPTQEFLPEEEESVHSTAVRKREAIEDDTDDLFPDNEEFPPVSTEATLLVPPIGHFSEPSDHETSEVPCLATEFYLNPGFYFAFPDDAPPEHFLSMWNLLGKETSSDVSDQESSSHSIPSLLCLKDATDEGLPSTEDEGLPSTEDEDYSPSTDYIPAKGEESDKETPPDSKGSSLNPHFLVESTDSDVPDPKVFSANTLDGDLIELEDDTLSNLDQKGSTQDSQVSGEKKETSPHESTPLFVKVPPSEFGYGPKPGSNRSLTINTTSTEELGDFVVMSTDLSAFPSQLFSELDLEDILDETKEFLSYVKTRIVDGKLNWKQRLGIVGGVAIGIYSAFAMLQIYLYEIIVPENESINFPLLEDGIIGLYFMFFFDGMSRNPNISIKMLEDDVDLFSIKKACKHRVSLILSKAGLYGSALMAGLMPTYYFYRIYCGDNDICKPDNPLYSTVVKGIISGSIGLVLDTILHYGHQLSQQATKWIDDYFSRRIEAGFYLSLIELKRQRYLTCFKEIEELIDRLGGAKLSSLYEDIFIDSTRSNPNDPALDLSKMTIQEALHTLTTLQAFHKKHEQFIPSENPNTWRKTVASWIGWGGALLASAGRHLIFWAAVEDILDDFITSIYLRYPLSILFGGIIGALVQGFIEKDAITKTVYEMLGGRKISESQSHGVLRRSIMVYNSLMGILATFPYLYVAQKLTRGYEDENGNHVSGWTAWERILCLVPFGLADALNNWTAFNDSILGIINAFDNLKASCCTCSPCCLPSEEYMRYRLIGVTMELRKRFKELRGDILEDIDRLLNPQPQRNQGLKARSPLLLDENDTE